MSGARKLDVRRDLPAITELLHLAFGRQLRLAGASLEDDLRLARASSPLAWLLSLLSSRFREQFLGYVWEEEGRLVGNVSLSRTDDEGRNWIIGNVAVHPAYRRRGIARGLVRMALDECRARGAEVVSLEVSRDNKPAYALYLGLGFFLVHSVTRLRLDSVPSVRPESVPDYRLRRLTRGDWPRVAALLRLTASPAPAGLRPTRTFDGTEGWGRSLVAAVSDWLTGRHRERWILEKGDALVALLEVVALGGQSTHSLRLVVHPESRGAVEEPMVRWSLARLSSLRKRPVLTEVATSDGAQLAAMRHFGFQVVETLDTLAVSFPA